MSVIVSAYTERLDPWIPTFASTEGGGGWLEFLTLENDGNLSAGFWIVTGEVRRWKTPVDWTGIEFYLNSPFYGGIVAAGGSYYNNYDSDEWMPFSMVRGWNTDQPQSMIADAYVANDTECGFELRNVRMAFIQVNDFDGFRPYDIRRGADNNLVSRMAWTTSVINVTYTSSYETIFDPAFSLTDLSGPTNCLFHCGTVAVTSGDVGANSCARIVTSVNGSNYGTTPYRRPFGYTHCPTYTCVEKSSSPKSVVLDAYSYSGSGSYSMTVHGAFILQALDTDDDFTSRYDESTVVSSGGSSGDLLSTEILTEEDPTSRFIILASGVVRPDSDTANVWVDASVDIGDNELGRITQQTVSPVVHRAECYFDYFTMANVVSQDDRYLKHKVHYNNNNTYGDNASTWAIKMDRNYHKQTFKAPAFVENRPAGTVEWVNANNVLDWTTDTYASQTLSTTTSENKRMQVGDFGFDEIIPEDAEIGYIHTYIPCRVGSGTGTVVWDILKMAFGETTVGTSCHPATPLDSDWWAAPGTNVNFGIDTYWTLDNTAGIDGDASRDGLWDYKPTAAQVRSSDFGFRFRFKISSGSSARVDVAYVACSVFYRIPGENFTRVATATASQSSEAGLLRDSTRNIGVTHSPAIGLPKDIVQTAKDTTVGNTAAGSRVAGKNVEAEPVVMSLLSWERAFTKGVAVISTIVEAMPKLASRATNALTQSSAAASIRGALKIAPVEEPTLTLWEKYTTKVQDDLTANADPIVAKTPIKPADVSAGTTVGASKIPTKLLRKVVTPVVLVRKKLFEVLDLVVTPVVDDTIRKLTKYSVDLAVTVLGATNLRKRMRTTKGTTQGSAATFNVFWTYVLSLGNVTVDAVAATNRRAKKVLRKTQGSTRRIRKASALTRSTTKSIVGTIAKRAKKTGALTVSRTLTWAKLVKRFVGRRYANIVYRLRKRTTVPTDAQTVANTVEFSKRARKLLVLSPSLNISMLKRIARTFKKRTLNKIVRLRKKTMLDGAVTKSATVAFYKKPKKVAVLSATTTLGFLKKAKKRISDTVGNVVSATAETVSLAKIYRVTVTELRGFYEVASGILRLRNTSSQATIEYLDALPVKVDATEEATVKIGNTEVAEVKITPIEEVELKL